MNEILNFQDIIFLTENDNICYPEKNIKNRGIIDPCIVARVAQGNWLGRKADSNSAWTLLELYGMGWHDKLVELHRCVSSK